MSIKKLIYTATFFYLIIQSAYGNSIRGKVVGVIDGDTLRVLSGKTPFLVRLEHIDCPEKRQPYGKKALALTSKLCFLKPVTVVYSKRDRYSRLLGVVYVNGTNLNQLLVKQGLAWWYRKYSKHQTYEKLESKAKKRRYGLWKQAQPEPPWVYRQKMSVWKSAEPARQIPTMAEYARQYIELDHARKDSKKADPKKSPSSSQSKSSRSSPQVYDALLPSLDI